MSEGITERVKRIIAGGMNAVVDAVEDTAPEVFMEQAIREVDVAMDEVRTELGRALATKHLATKRLSEENDKHLALAEKIELAVSRQREDLAEAAISQQLDIEAQLPVLERSIDDAAHRERELEGYLTALQGKKREMQHDLSAFRASRKMSEPTDVPSGSNVAARMARAESAFERLMLRHTGLPLGTHAADAKTATQLAELEELSRKNRIQERLAAVKAKSG